MFAAIVVLVALKSDPATLRVAGPGWPTLMVPAPGPSVSEPPLSWMNGAVVVLVNVAVAETSTSAPNAPLAVIALPVLLSRGPANFAEAP